jgi:NADH:ubiquinone oxidoreductase subunit K
MVRASIFVICVIGLAAVLAVIATGISAGWQREHQTSQLRDVRPFHPGLNTPSRLASAEVAP